MRIQEARKKIGKVVTGGMPAAWWYSDDAENNAAYERWREDYRRRSDEIIEFGKAQGINDRGDIRIWEGGKYTELRGFAPPKGMGKWESHPNYMPVPEGWRIDSKSGYLVPSRRTKKDRESEANKEFNRLRRIPNSLAYMSGMPEDLFIPGSHGVTHMYSPTIWKGGQFVAAYIGGDPDRSEQPFKVDGTKWHRLPLDLYRQLRDSQQEDVA